MGFDDNNFFGGGEPSRRDKLEIGNDGKTTADSKKQRQEEQQRNFMEMDGKGGDYGGKGGKFRNKFRRKQGGNGKYRGGRSGGGGSVLLAIVLISVPVIIVGLLFTGNLNGVFRSFMATPEQNTNTLFQGFYDSQNLLHDSYLTDAEREQVAVYRKNEISRIEFIDEQVYPEYLVYVYSDSEEKNEAFTDFVVEAEAKGFPVPIFRISADITKDYFITDTSGVNEPAFAIYRNNTGMVEYDSMVNDPEQFSKLESYMEEIVKQDDEYFKNSKGSYGDAEWLNPEESVEESKE